MHCGFLSDSLFYLTHIVVLDIYLYSAIILFNACNYISVPVSHFVRGRGQNIYRLEI